MPLDSTLDTNTSRSWPVAPTWTIFHQPVRPPRWAQDQGYGSHRRAERRGGPQSTAVGAATTPDGAVLSSQLPVASVRQGRSGQCRAHGAGVLPHARPTSPFPHAWTV